MKKEIIIIGAGAAGLMAARQLSGKGYKVTILEADSKAGGRIQTLLPVGFKNKIEEGAEFVHGKLPVTLSLFEEADIHTREFDGEIWEVDGNTAEQDSGFVETNAAFRRKLESLEEDMTVAGFLQTYFPGEAYASMKQSIARYVEGYEAADTEKASILAMKSDLLEPEQEQFRPAGGYGLLVEYLLKQCREQGCEIIYAAPVTHVHWEKDKVRVITPSANFTAGKLLVTVPLGILQCKAGEEGYIQFTPAIPGKIHAAQSLGWGTVIKVLLEFKRPFWNNDTFRKHSGIDSGELGFIFSQQAVPTWWTQAPAASFLLTGWLAGPAAWYRKDTPDSECLDLALGSLAGIFKIPVSNIRDMLAASYIANWGAKPYIKGAYAYKTPGAENVIRELEQPVEDTVFFAGEAVYNGPYAGTVEAALASAVDAVKRITVG